MNGLIKIILNRKTIIIGLFLLLSIFAGLQAFILSNKTYEQTGEKASKYNNYIIFKQSFNHLTENKDLYQLYPKEHKDLYKYSPTFSVFFGAFTLIPDVVGLTLWNILNALVFLLAIYYLPRLNLTQKGLILMICLLEFMTSIQNQQSNALVAGLIILTFGLAEKRYYFFATLCIVFSVYIKVFGVVGLALFLFYPEKWKLALYTAGWSILLFVLPLIFVSIDQLEFLYKSWGHLLDNDHTISYGFSAMGWLHAWFGIDSGKQAVLIAGILLFMIPLIRIKEYKNFTFRFLTLTSILLWVIIFNHKAESPTFIIAMAGVALWFITGKKNALNITLFVSALILTSLSPTDLFPKFLRDGYVEPLMLKVFPCILIWLKIFWDMLVVKTDTIGAEESPYGFVPTR
jgi:hypothetical protein